MIAKFYSRYRYLVAAAERNFKRENIRMGVMFMQKAHELELRHFNEQKTIDAFWYGDPTTPSSPFQGLAVRYAGIEAKA